MTAAAMARREGGGSNNAIFFVTLAAVIVIGGFILSRHAVEKHGSDAIRVVRACATEDCDKLFDELCDDGKHYRIVRVSEHLYGLLITDVADEHVITAFITKRQRYLKKVMEVCH